MHKALIALLIALSSSSIPYGLANPPAAATASALAEGEVRRVDRDAGRITLRHGPIASLGMPAMTMAFRVQDAAWLEGLRAGDRVRFEAVHLDGAYVITRLERLK
ncbi:MAG: copper-binding protein [Thiobacillaceae bacterium]|nr:copper-binding protein [Thiobacillaceae bacterium]MDW8324840.1 copper-binding protein [Burkholderiales bacterium]